MDIEQEIKHKINKGLIDYKLQPIKCECGSTNFNDKATELINYIVAEKYRYCNVCRKCCGYWSYGCWMP